MIKGGTYNLTSPSSSFSQTASSRVVNKLNDSSGGPWHRASHHFIRAGVSPSGASLPNQRCPPELLQVACCSSSSDATHRGDTEQRPTAIPTLRFSRASLLASRTSRGPSGAPAIRMLLEAGAAPPSVVLPSGTGASSYDTRRHAVIGHVSLLPCRCRWDGHRPLSLELLWLPRE